LTQSANGPHPPVVLLSLILSMTVATAAMTGTHSTAPLTLEATTPLPAIGKGDFDHFTVDLRRHVLFLAAEKNGTIETFDLLTGKHLQSARGVNTPHKIVYVAQKNEIFIADGGDSSVKVLDASTLHVIARIPVSAGPDTGAYDAQAGLFYVGNGGKAAHLPYSNVSIISVDKRAVVGTIRIPGKTLKGMYLDRGQNRIFVSVRDKSEIVVIDLRKRAVVATYTSPYLKTNVPIGLDDEGRLFVGGRKPNALVIMKAGDGTVLQHLPTVAESDDLWVDGAHHRVYVSGSTGLDVFAEGRGGRYALESHYDTQGGKTSILIPSLQRFYVAHSTDDAPESALLTFRVNP
jgi:YVTN family beta-propeller protein